MQASPTDLWATKNTIEFAGNENIQCKILFNRYNPTSKISLEINKQITSPKFKNFLGNRVVFSSCFMEGLTVTEKDPRSKAAEEVKNLTKEVLAIFAEKKEKSLAKTNNY